MVARSQVGFVALLLVTFRTVFVFAMECGVGKLEVDGQCVWFHPEPMIWQDAERGCEPHLLTVYNKTHTEGIYVAGDGTETEWIPEGTEKLWIGLEAWSKGDGVWRWTSGHDAPLIPPRGSSPERRCAALRRVSTRQYIIEATSCSDRLPSVCSIGYKGCFIAGSAIKFVLEQKSYSLIKNELRPQSFQQGVCGDRDPPVVWNGTWVTPTMYVANNAGIPPVDCRIWTAEFTPFSSVVLVGCEGNFLKTEKGEVCGAEYQNPCFSEYTVVDKRSSGVPARWKPEESQRSQPLQSAWTAAFACVAAVLLLAFLLVAGKKKRTWYGPHSSVRKQKPKQEDEEAVELRPEGNPLEPPQESCATCSAFTEADALRRMREAHSNLCADLADPCDVLSARCVHPSGSESTHHLHIFEASRSLHSATLTAAITLYIRSKPRLPPCKVRVLGPTAREGEGEREEGEDALSPECSTCSAFDAAASVQRLQEALRSLTAEVSDPLPLTSASVSHGQTYHGHTFKVLEPPSPPVLRALSTLYMRTKPKIHGSVRVTIGYAAGSSGDSGETDFAGDDYYCNAQWQFP